MDFKFSSDEAKGQDKTPTPGKGRQSGQLIVLLVLVGLFGYIYFFTGLIRPQPASKPAEPPEPQVVKKPLPARGAETGTETVAAPETNKQGTPPAAEPKQEAAKTAKAGAAAPAPAPAPMPAPAPASKEAPKAKPEVKKAEVVKPAEKKQPAKPAVTAERKPLPATAAVKNQAPQEKKAAAAKPTTAKPAATPVAAKPVAAKPVVAKSVAAKSAAGAEKGAAAPKAKLPAAQSEKKKVAKVAKAEKGPWTIVTGPYLLEDSMAADLARIRKAGLQASVQADGRKKTVMNRLFLGAYGDRSAALAELDKVKHYTSDAFIIDLDGRHVVYAGSYLLDERAVSEKDRLAAAGFSVTLKRAEVAIPAKVLTAGTYNDKTAAEAALRKLRKAGLKAHLSR